MSRDVISIIDDDEAIRRTAKRLIQSFGFQAAVFESAEGYLGSSEMRETACLVIDMKMPGMDGLELQKRLAAEGLGAPIIFITAYDNEEIRGRAMQAGAIAFLAKPFSDAELLEAIRSALEGGAAAPKVIAVVDDDESIRRTMALLIESFGFRAVVFESAEDFLKGGYLSRVSCLLADLQMPGMDGLQLQSQLAASGINIPIIFITAYDSQESRRRAMQAGAVAFLGKPFSDKQLLEAVRSALGRHDGTKSPG